VLTLTEAAARYRREHLGKIGRPRQSS